MLQTMNVFERFWALGYRRLVPIIPPDAEISERSSLFKRVGTPQDSRGKAVGVRGHGGKWFGFDWVPHEADSRDVARWHGMAAGVGVKTGWDETAGCTLIALDADTKNLEFARIIRDEIARLLGVMPVRVGNYPKALYLCRVSGPLPYQRIEFGPRDERGNAERLEILSDGRQFVADGVHPKTREPYQWPVPVVPFADLPVFTPEQIEGLLQALQAALPDASKVIREGGGEAVAQEALRGDLEHVRKAVAAIPNSSEHFPSRESYRDVGYAIKAALPDDPEDAFEIFADWCARWEEGDNDPGVVEADWRRMKPPFRRGASWLYELAETIAPLQFSKVGDVWYDAALIQAPGSAEIFPNPFGEPAPPATDTYPLLTIDELIARPPPTWLIERHVPEVGTGFLYGAPGAKKSFLALDQAMAISHGLETWQGDAIHAEPEAVVIYIASEGSFDLRNRIKAWLKARGLDKASKRFLVIERTIDFLDNEDVNRLLRTVAGAGGRPALVVVDTVSRSMPGADENLQKDMTLFIRACDLVRDRHRCAVIGIHHANKSGDDMRGSTVLRGAGDFVFRLETKKGATIGTLTCEKQKAAPDGWSEPYRFDVVHLEDGESSLVPARADIGVGPDVALTPDAAAMALRAMGAAWDAGEPWSKAPQARERFAVRRMVADFGFRAEGAEELLAMWEGSGIVAHTVYDSRSKKTGFKVLAVVDKVSSDEGVFG